MSYGAPNAPSGGASSDPAAALRGASLAFSKKKPPAPPPPSKSSNGALAAATLSSQSTGGSVNGLPDMDAAAARSIVAGRMQQLAAASGQSQQSQQYGSHLQTPPRVDPKSTSFIAATLAASRNGSPSPPKPAAAQTASPAPRRKASVGAMSSVSSADVAVDSEPIPPTGSLISIFEEGGRGGGGDPVKKTPVRGKRSVDESLALRRETADEGVALRAAEKRPLKTEPKTQATPPRLNRLVTQDRTDMRESDLTSSPSSPRPRQRAPQSAGPVELNRPEVKTSRSPPRLKNLVSQNTSDGKRLEVKEIGSSPVQTAVPRITNKYNSPQTSNPPQFRPLTPPPQSAGISSLKQEAVKPPPKPKRAPTQTTRPPTPPESRSSAPPPKPKPSVDKPAVAVSSKQRSAQALPLGENSGPVSKPVVKSSAPPTPPKPRKPQSSSNLKQSQALEDNKRPVPSKSKGERSQAPAPPKPRGSSKPLSKVSSNRDTDSPEPVGLHRTKTTDTMDSANDVFVSAPTSPELAKSPPVFPPRHRKTTSGPPSPTRDVQRQRSATASSTNKNQALDSLTSAIMAGSLAAARLTPHSTGTSLPPPVTPIRQKSPRLRQTLRGPVDSSEDEEDRHIKKHRPKLGRGKHAHHEGSRRRWRDEVTPRERKRYEAVWASNRGIHLPHAASPSASSLSSSGRDNLKDFSHSVANVVVREVWKRSRLPEDELIEVWDLVDRDKRGVLSRQEFVVGMWLIDQRLKGRKIPTKVSESVWGSASGNGLMVIKPKAK
ncbi:unnamed protein product [Clonostachys rosea]|uniref:EH domain-containing protein n=1 Tax=Bionectria ochroleuca TaxID=29856 RepID=A0ABY6TSD3_BIOOC|nr:unnamed protein product [Clonostachys rosea]